MTRHPVTFRKAASASTAAVPTVREIVPPATGTAAGAQVVRSASFAPMRSTLGPSSLNNATSGAWSGLKKLSVRCDFSKLRPRSPGAIVPTTLSRLTDTVLGTDGPVQAGPPLTGLLQMPEGGALLSGGGAASSAARSRSSEAWPSGVAGEAASTGTVETRSG